MAESGESLQTIDDMNRFVGMKYLKRLGPFLQRLHDEACERDRAGNRELHFDHLCGMILLSFFNPTLQTLRNLSESSRTTQVKKKLGAKSASLGSLSEAMRLFDSERLLEIIQELIDRIPDASHHDPRLLKLDQIPTAVDGTLLKRLPQVTEACFKTRQDRGWKLHTHFEILRGIPVKARLTDASGKGDASEKGVLKKELEPDRCDITDRGYEQFSLFNAIVKAKSSYVFRVRGDHHFQLEEQRELSAEAKEAGVLEDQAGRMGSEKSVRIEHPDHLQRRIVIQFTPHTKRGGRRRTGATQEIVVVTNLLEVPAEVIALLYHQRWMIELFFRWLKCVLSCRHLMSTSQNGIEIQMYCALIACLLIQLTAGREIKPNSSLFTMISLYAQGWADDDNLQEALERQWSAVKKES
ncbi:MAG: IS4 family transposase [Planctomycetaceae bacterium]